MRNPIKPSTWLALALIALVLSYRFLDQSSASILLDRFTPLAIALVSAALYARALWELKRIGRLKAEYKLGWSIGIALASFVAVGAILFMLSAISAASFLGSHSDTEIAYVIYSVLFCPTAFVCWDMARRARMGVERDIATTAARNTRLL